MKAMTSSEAERPAKVRFGIVLLPDFTLSALSLFLDPIRLAADERDRSQQVHCAWDILTLSGDPVKSSSGLTVNPTAPIGMLERCDYVVVIGGLIPRYWTGRQALIDLLRSSADRGQQLVGLCTGAFALAEAGLLEDRTCSVNWFHKDDFTALYERCRPDIVSQFHRSGRHYTCAGGLGAACLAISLIAGDVSEEQARKAASILLIPYDIIDAEQPMPILSGIRSPLVRRAIRIFEETLDDPVSMAEIARRLGISRRQMERAFRANTSSTAVKIRERIRVRKAKELLRDTGLPLIEIAIASGFMGTGSMNRSFARQNEVPPRELRNMRNAYDPTKAHYRSTTLADIPNSVVHSAVKTSF